ncbi:oligosaccharide flippase family protein [Paenibacillus rhizoplanae]
MITDKVVTMIIGIFITAVIARYLGPENYGKFNYALAFVSLFTAISTLGLEVFNCKIYC